MLREILPWINQKVQIDDDQTKALAKRLRQMLLVKKVSVLERLSRLLFSQAVYLSSRKRYRLNEILINLRNLFSRSKKAFAELEGIKIYLELKQRLNLPMPDWQGRQAVVCLSHDIDYLDGWHFIKQVADAEKKFGFRSTFNILTAGDYLPERSLLKQLSEDGFEIGLHGVAHDIALAYRDRREIEKTIERATAKLGMPVKGFRSPALCTSEVLLDVLENKGFSYDSSVQVESFYGQAQEFCFPYRYPGRKLLEIPLGIQDDIFFRAFRLSEKQALQSSFNFIEEVRKVGGVVLINTHPGIIRKKLNYYLGLLEYLSEQQNIWVCTPGELSNYINLRDDN